MLREESEESWLWARGKRSAEKEILWLDIL